MRELLKAGLYRHFKGAYYYVTGVSKNAIDDSIMVNYFNVQHPELGSCVRPLNDFTRMIEEDGRIIKERPDNVTGQSSRFEKVEDLNFQIGSVSTEQLVEELSKREDSPLQKLDIKGLNDRVYCTDYCVGNKHLETQDFPRGVTLITSFATEEEAKKYYETHKHLKTTGVFKRTFIELK